MATQELRMSRKKGNLKGLTRGCRRSRWIGSLMPKSLISMGMDKAQIALLREIAQQMCKEAATEIKVVKRSSSIKKSSSLMSKIKIYIWLSTQQCSTSAAAGKVLFPFEAQEAPLKSTGMTS